MLVRDPELEVRDAYNFLRGYIQGSSNDQNNTRVLVGQLEVLYRLAVQQAEQQTYSSQRPSPDEVKEAARIHNAGLEAAAGRGETQ